MSVYKLIVSNEVRDLRHVRILVLIWVDPDLVLTEREGAGEQDSQSQYRHASIARSKQRGGSWLVALCTGALYSLGLWPRDKRQGVRDYADAMDARVHNNYVYFIQRR